MVGLSNFFSQSLAADAFKSQLRLVGNSAKQQALAQSSPPILNTAAGSTDYSGRGARISGLDQAIKNISQASGMISIAETTLSQVATKLTRMRALTFEAGQSVQTTAERTTLNSEFQNLTEQIQYLSTTTAWRGRKMLDGSLGTVSFQVGPQETQTLQITFVDINTDFGVIETSQAGIDENSATDLDVFTNLSLTDASSLSGDETIDLAAQVITGSQQSITLEYIDTAILRVSNYQKDLTLAKEQLTQRAESLEYTVNSSRKTLYRMMESDEAIDIARLVRIQILQNAGMIHLTQANHSALSVMSLLKE